MSMTSQCLSPLRLPASPSSPRRPAASRTGSRSPALVPALALLLALAPGVELPGGAPSAAAANLQWEYTDGSCGKPGGLDAVECGAYGDFEVGVVASSLPRASGGGSGCIDGVQYGATENHRLLPRPDLPQSLDDWQPCRDGDCFSTGVGDGPWAAVLDWDDAHGWSVGETVLEASGDALQVRLFSLDQPVQPALQQLSGVGDAHVLAQLCALSEELSHGTSEAPLVVNMSFGRLASDVAEKLCLADSLECEILRVIDHLHGTYGVHFVGAAGNQGSLLFPAVSPWVMAVGAADVTYYGERRQLRPSGTAPPQAEALFPAHGLVLERGDELWPAPAGSSYASAFAAGWIGDYLKRYPGMAAAVFHPPMNAGPLAFVELGLDGVFHLGRDGVGLPDSVLPAASQRLATAVGDRPEVWDVVLRSRTELRQRLDRVYDSLPDVTYDEMQETLNVPAPQSRPCVPCHDLPPEPPPLAGGERLAGAVPQQASELAIDLSWSEGIPDELELMGLFVQVGEQVYSFEGSFDPVLLTSFSYGEVERLVIEGLPSRGADEEVLLVYELELRADPGAGTFTDFTPVVIHGD